MVVLLAKMPLAPEWPAKDRELLTSAAKCSTRALFEMASAAMASQTTNDDDA